MSVKGRRQDGPGRDPPSSGLDGLSGWEASAAGNVEVFGFAVSEKWSLPVNRAVFAGLPKSLQVLDSPFAQIRIAKGIGMKRNRIYNG